MRVALTAEIGENKGRMIRRVQEDNRILKLLPALIFLIGVGNLAAGREQPAVTPFKFVGGTEKLPEACEGLMEVESTALTFKCSNGSVPVPYSAITLMQYRPDISKKVWKMKIKWKVKPGFTMPLVGGKKNRYFTIVYAENGETRAIVLEVSPARMRPYLAEIDVKAGKRVEVKEYQEYD
jgi:hypothetical protein